MNCFNWQNHIVDYLDGLLCETLHTQMDEHLQSCAGCTQHYQQTLTLIHAIAHLPKTDLPESFREATAFRIRFPWIKTTIWKLFYFKKIPWYLKIFVQGAVIIAFVLSGIIFIPQLKMVYEHKLGKTHDELHENFALHDDHQTEALENFHQKSPFGHSSGTKGTPSSSELKAAAGAVSDSSQLWRFTLKTVSPDELRPQVIQILTHLKLSMTLPGMEGIEVPGGIEFDLLLPKGLVSSLKQALQSLAVQSLETGPLPKIEPFSWYRIQSKRKLPEGKAQVIIWLAQPH